jgi:tetratricopeptide (TPR) repeat protein
VYGELSAADIELEQMAQAAERLRQPAQQAFVLVCRAMRALLVGSFAEAETFTNDALELGRRAHPMVDVYFRLQLYVLRREQGRLDELEGIVRRSVEESQAYLIWPCVLADLYAKLERESEARQVFDALARDNFESLPLDEEWALGMALLAEVCAYLGDADRARVLYGLLLPSAGQNVYGAVEASVGAADRYLGLLSGTQGDWAQAARHFEGALALNERMGASPWLAHTQEDYARMLLARDEPGDRDGAAQLVAQALVTYRELGMDSYAARASALAQEAVAPAR